MKSCQLEDLLDEQSRLLMQSSPPAEPQSPLPQGAAALAPLLQLAREIVIVLVPIKPRPAFRRALHRSLVVEARRQQTRRTLSLARPNVELPMQEALPNRVLGWLEHEANAMPTERRWVIGAAAVGSAVSLAGVVAYVLHRRGRLAAA
jgi:hypothetical protein